MILQKTKISGERLRLTTYGEDVVQKRDPLNKKGSGDQEIHF